MNSKARGNPQHANPPPIAAWGRGVIGKLWISKAMTHRYYRERDIHIPMYMWMHIHI